MAAKLMATNDYVAYYYLKTEEEKAIYFSRKFRFAVRFSLPPFCALSLTLPRSRPPAPAPTAMRTRSVVLAGVALLASTATAY
jgi:hypothetical protein